MSEDNKNNEQNIETDYKIDRFAYLSAQAKKFAELEERIKASYHHNSADEAKAAKAAVDAAAEEDRKLPKLDPLELIRQVDQMRKEGFSEEVIRAAFDEIMAQHVVKFTVYVFNKIGVR